MSITNYDVLVDPNIDGLKAKVATAIAAAWQPSGSTFKVGDLFAQNMVKTDDEPAAVTATTGGGTTGLIPAGASFAVVTSDSANKSISLPAADVGKELTIYVSGATACELISAVAADEVNDVVVGATNELALTAGAIYTCRKVTTVKWIVTGETKLGARIAALVPDALA